MGDYKNKPDHSDSVGNVGAYPERQIHERAKNWSEQRRPLAAQ